jgi:diguanylate cyclase (GGDEF)-like protein
MPRIPLEDNFTDVIGKTQRGLKLSDEKLAEKAGVTIAELVDRLRSLERQAVTDPLTGAFNRRHLDRCLRTAIDRRNRFREPACLVLFDVDRFKSINDTLGHATGDAVLKALVVLVGRRARSMDVLFRTGGEEFALLLSGTRLTAALGVAEHLRALVAASHFIDHCSVSISLGVSELRDRQSAADWIEQTDRALYSAKRNGRNRVAGLTPPAILVSRGVNGAQAM